MLELFDIMRKGYLSQISSVIDDVTGKRPITLSQFGKDYSTAFTWQGNLSYKAMVKLIVAIKLGTKMGQWNCKLCHLHCL